MSVNASRTRLAALTKELIVSWHRTRDRWRDAKCEEFRQRYMDELVESVNTSLSVLDKLDKALNRIRKDCE